MVCGYDFQKKYTYISYLHINFVLENNADPDEMWYYCLPKCPFGVFGLQRVDRPILKHVCVPLYRQLQLDDTKRVDGM